jgi:hypothetical protein
LQEIEEFAITGSGLTSIIIPASVEIFHKQCFSNCKSLTSIIFEPNSQLHRIQEFAFTFSRFTSIIIPASVELLCTSSFFNCKSLAAITLKSNSQLHRIEEFAFAFSDLTFVAKDLGSILIYRIYPYTWI